MYQGQETITVPAGTFKTWKILVTNIIESIIEITTKHNEWWSEEYGLIMTKTIPDNSTDILTSFTIPQ
jgi:hypothetical protein